MIKELTIDKIQEICDKSIVCSGCPFYHFKCLFEGFPNEWDLEYIYNKYNNNLEKIKSCKFCGEENELDVEYLRNSTSEGYRVRCINCQKTNWLSESEKEAIESWNKENKDERS